MIKPPRNICVVRLSALGDIVHTLSMVNAIKKAWPKTQLSWLLTPLSMEVVKHQSNIDEFILYDAKNGMAGLRALRKTLAKRHFDLAVIPQVSARVNLICAMLKADIKLGFDFGRARELNWLFTNQKIPARKSGHVQDQFFEFLHALNIPFLHPEWDIRFTPEERVWQKAFFDNIGKPVISFVIATSDPKKDWHAKGYAAVMDHVAEKLDAVPMIVGGPSAREQSITNEILSLCQCRPVIALEKPVRHTLLQLAGSKIVVAPDTGPLHMAVALNVPTVGLYGASDPRRCGPYKKFTDLLIDKYADPGDRVDRPITRKLKPSRMLQITPEAVIEKINLALSNYPLH